VTHPENKTPDLAALDALTAGAFTAATSGERITLLQTWLLTEPSLSALQDVFKEMSHRDKGAAKVLRDSMDEKRRNIEQEALAHSWAEKGAALRDAPRINIADAMAWQRDAAKAGAPLSREPLAGLKTALADRVKAIEDLQHQSQVQREAAVLLAQRIEVLSTKPWQDAQAQREALQADLDRWHAQAKSLTDDAQWSSVDAKFPPALQTSAQQLQAVWLAFGDALQLTEAAAADPQAPLPAVPAWAEQIRQVRNPSQTQAPVQTVEPSLNASTGPAIGVASEATRKVKPLGDKVLIDQQRLELAMQAEALFKPASTKTKEKAPPKDEEVPGATTEDLSVEAVEEIELVPAMGGRKMQETLRNLREEWKKVDKQAAPNPALWKRFDAACNKAHVVVDAWLKEARAQTAANKAQRLALIEELKTWAAEHAQGPDWKGVARQLHQFAQRWRESGHLSEKMFAELQPQWKAAIHAAHEPLEAVQKASLERRNALIAEAQALGAAPTLRIDAVKALQQRWQEEAHAVVLDRRLEQKLWDAFRKPIDEAFARKSTVREQAQAALTPIDKAVMEASKAVESAVAKGDASAIRAAMQNLEKVSRGELPTAEPSPVVVAAVASAPAPAPEEPSVATATEVLAEPVEIEESKVASEPAQEISQDASSSSESLQETQSGLATETPTETPTETTAEAAPEITPEVATDLPVESVAPTPTPKAAPRPVVAVRGDDRPGQKRTELPSQGSRGRDGKPGGKGAIGGKAGGKFGDKPGGGWRDREDSAPRGPRLGEAAFRAQRFAIDNAQDALRRLAAQAHGEVLTQLLHAWEKRDPEQMPAAQAIGNKLNAAQRTQWTQALAKAPAADATQALLRMEMAADLPTPAAHMDARRALQLQLLTRRNDPSPQMTWAADAAQVLSSGYDEANGRRLQSALKVLLKR
jgi:ATP-dependent RNA helicase SUPV3L1/SUV3